MVRVVAYEGGQGEKSRPKAVRSVTPCIDVTPQAPIDAHAHTMAHALTCTQMVSHARHSRTRARGGMRAQRA